MFYSNFHLSKALLRAPLILLSLTTAAAFSCASGEAVAAQPSAAEVPRVRTLENRFFFHTYEQDPVEKRLQRLELLVFGQTKSGDEQQRLQHLNTTIAERDRESALKMQKQHQDATSNVAPPENTAKIAPPAPNATVPGSTQHYPAVTALEWRILKKSYSSESLDDRLGRLETKIFGQPSSSMSYADRVDRLNRTLGIGSVASTPTGKLRGPLPRTRPQTEEQPFPSFRGDGNFGGGYFGFADPNQKQVSELFKQMNEQMEQMMRMTPGALPNNMYPIPMQPIQPKDKSGQAPQWKEWHKEWKIQIPPGGSGSGNWSSPGHQSLPSYNDPNSI